MKIKKNCFDELVQLVTNTCLTLNLATNSRLKTSPITHNASRKLTILELCFSPLSLRNIDFRFFFRRLASPEAIVL